MSLKEIIPSFAMKKTPGTDDFTESGEDIPNSQHYYAIYENRHYRKSTKQHCSRRQKTVQKMLSNEKPQTPGAVCSKDTGHFNIGKINASH